MNAESSVITKGVGTVLYRAPEVENSRFYDSKADMYSLGVIIFEIYYGHIATYMEKSKIISDLREGKIPQDFDDRAGPDPQEKK